MGFKERVIDAVKKIPKGKVMSYGQVAAAAGKPNGAREVGRILSSIDVKPNRIPWWRVLNNKGVISIKGNWTATKELQKKLLEKDGIIVSDDYKLDIKEYGYLKTSNS